MSVNDDLVLKTVLDIQAEKRNARRMPDFATFRELSSRLKDVSDKDIRHALIGLVNAKKISIGRTLNDEWIAGIREEGEIDSYET